MDAYEMLMTDIVKADEEAAYAEDVIWMDAEACLSADVNAFFANWEGAKA